MSTIIPSPRTVTPSVRRHRLWLPTPHRRQKAAADARNLTLRSTGTGVPASLIAQDPTLMALVVEDLCWSLAADDVDRRRPPRRRREAFRAWREDAARCETDRERIAEQAAAAIHGL